MSEYMAIRDGGNIVITIPIAAVTDSLDREALYYGADAVEVLDQDALCDLIVSSLNRENGIESMILAEVSGAIDDGSPAVRLRRGSLSAPSH